MSIKCTDEQTIYVNTGALPVSSEVRVEFIQFHLPFSRLLWLVEVFFVFPYKFKCFALVL